VPEPSSGRGGAQSIRSATLGVVRCILPLLLLVVGCGKAPLAAGDFPAEFARAVCEVEARCRNEAHFLEQQCEEETAALYAPDLDKAVARGKAVFDPAQGQACVEGLRARGCEPVTPETSQACERAVTGKVGQGEPCNWLFECAAGRCEPASPGACPAACGPVAGEGGSCAAMPCDLRAGLRCIDRVCSRLRAAGGGCRSSSDCGRGLFCTAVQKCAARGGEQAGCDADEECAVGLFCDVSREGGLCRKRFAQGEACTTGSAEAIRLACADGMVCRGFSYAKAGATAGVCAAAGEPGASCVASAQVSGCAEGLSCVGGTCAEKSVSGPCAQDDECRDGVAYCDGANCRLLLANGAACAASSQCEERFCEPVSMKCEASDPSCHEP
jgi:hypothetical protein